MSLAWIGAGIIVGQVGIMWSLNRKTQRFGQFSEALRENTASNHALLLALHRQCKHDPDAKLKAQLLTDYYLEREA